MEKLHGYVVSRYYVRSKILGYGWVVTNRFGKVLHRMPHQCTKAEVVPMLNRRLSIMATADGMPKNVAIEIHQ